MDVTGTILLTRSDVAKLLTMEECISGVESVFRSHAEGGTVSPQVLGMHVAGGGFHIKAGVSEKYFVAKLNANFPLNNKQFGIPTIQGVTMVCDAINGKLLALIDSIEITIIRTGAATAVAAKYLSLADAHTATICGCGNQGSISVKALRAVRPLQRVYAYDIDEAQVRKFSDQFNKEVEVVPTTANNLSAALKQSQICITCTPAKQPFIQADDIAPGTFIGAVGADSHEKQELSLGLLCKSKIVVDLLEQSSKIGELHHALKQGRLDSSAVHAELGEIISGRKPGRESPEEIIIFDSTGTALQDVVAAAIVYEKAITNATCPKINFLQ
jgi:alanine dehydrogenase